MALANLHEKISVLSGAAKYDASCATSGSGGFEGPGGKKFGASLPAGVCHSWTEDGRCVSRRRRRPVRKADRRVYNPVMCSAPVLQFFI